MTNRFYSLNIKLNKHPNGIVCFYCCVSIVDTFTFHCAPSCQVYLDGVSANSSTKIETGLTVDIPAGTKVIAVNVYRKPLNAGFVGSSNHGVKTDLSWKCVRTVEHPWVANQNWQDPAYDDSLWPYANFYQYNNVRDVPWWPVYKDINNVAMWIGMGYNRDHEGTSLFCRKKIGKQYFYFDFAVIISLRMIKVCLFIQNLSFHTY